MPYSGNIMADMEDDRRERETMIEVECPECIEGLFGENTICDKCSGTGYILKDKFEIEEDAKIREAELKEDC